MLFKNRYTRYLAMGSLLLTLAACNKKLDANLDNPNSKTTNAISGSDVFANALQNTVYAVNSMAQQSPAVAAATVGISTLTNEWMGIWARTTSYSASGVQYQVETFALSNTYGDNFWSSMYHNMADYNFVAAKSAKGSILPGASLVMKTLVFQDLTDIFGDIPYSQALNLSIVSPAYDKAQAIYADLPLKLDSAMALISASQSTSDDASDIMFKGNKAKWLAFANTVKLRILLRQIPNAATAASLQAELNKTASFGYLTAGLNASINPGFKDATSQQSPFWANFGYQVGSTTNTYQSNTFYIANQTMVDYLKATSDPRLGYLYKTAKGGGYAGNFLGDLPLAKNDTLLSHIGPGILKSPTMDGIVMTASEGLFLQAEAIQRGLITNGNYLTVFNQAITESFSFLGAPGAATYLTSLTSSSDDRINPTTNPIKALIYQKWVANAEIDGLEIWSDYRRTGFPIRTNPSVNPAAASSNVIPKRLVYPQTETVVNAASYKAQNQQGSDIYTKIFWGL